jgi:uncharacterized membrane protein
MRANIFLRVFISGLVVCVFLFTQAGCNGQTRNGAGLAMQAAGGLVILIPHPVAKVVGVVLVMAGTALIVEYAINGETVRETIKLNKKDESKGREQETVVLQDPQGKSIAVKLSPDS